MASEDREIDLDAFFADQIVANAIGSVAHEPDQSHTDVSAFQHAAIETFRSPDTYVSPSTFGHSSDSYAYTPDTNETSPDAYVVSPEAFGSPDTRQCSEAHSSLETHQPPEIDQPSQMFNDAGVPSLTSTQPRRPRQRRYFRTTEKSNNAQKQFISENSRQTPNRILERLKESFPGMQCTRLDVQIAIGNERRKQSRREANGSWTQEELDIMVACIDQPPKKLHGILTGRVNGFQKNVDQVRDMKVKLVRKNGKRKGREEEKSISLQDQDE